MPGIDPSLVKQVVGRTLDEKMQLTETGDRAPDELGTVTGWRAWRVDRVADENGQVLLYSASFDYAWVPFEKARASCDKCTSEDPADPRCVPGQNCSCGFYTARSLDHLRRMGYHRYQNGDDAVKATIVGRVANWGKVIPGTQGWRAEYAYPEMLYVPFEIARGVAQAVSNTYGIPVTLLNLLDDNAKPGKRRGLAQVLPQELRERGANEPRFLTEYREAHSRSGDPFEDDDE